MHRQRHQQRNLHAARLRKSSLRAAITLFEVVLALAIFIGALTAISQVLRTGSRAAIRAQQASEAALRCELKMNEVVSGVVPLETVSEAAFEDGGPWVWSLNILDAEIPNLLRLEVTVTSTVDGMETPASFQLVRLMRDPIVYQTASTTTEAP